MGLLLILIGVVQAAAMLVSYQLGRSVERATADRRDSDD